MTAANDSVLVTPGSGATIATHTVGSKEHQVIIPADDAGHLRDTAPSYILHVSKQTPGANVVFCDLFNASGSGKTLKVKSIRAVMSGAAAETGALGIDVFLTRTSAVGTGGTAAGGDGEASAVATTGLTSVTLAKVKSGDSVLPSQVTARKTPTGGATAGQVLNMEELFTEETNAGTYITKEMWPFSHPLHVGEGTGIRLVQGSEANAEGQIAFTILFEAV